MTTTIQFGLAAFMGAAQTVETLGRKGVTPDFINVSQESSLLIEFTWASNYHMAEFCPNGDIVLLRRGSGGVKSWDLTAENYPAKLDALLADGEPVEPALSFIERCLRGEATPEQIEDYAQAWHNSDSTLPLFAYLGLSRDEYEQWLTSSEQLSVIIEARRSTQSME